MREYWKKNQILIAVLLSIWALVSYGFSIILARQLYEVKIGSLPMSFWWAQQGSMFVFVILIFVYARVMDHLDKKYGLDDGDES